MKTSKRIETIGVLVLPVVPALAVALYWIISAWRGESLSVAASYRHGDYNYFPPLAGLMHFNLGESLIFERLGEGIRAFPFASLALHGTALGLFGAAGFILADVLVAVFVYFAARAFFRASGLSALTTAILALVVSCGLVAWPGLHLERWIGWAPKLHLWGFRFPRPFLTDLFLLLCVGSWLRLVLQRREGLGEWAVLGLWFGLLLQSRFYSAATVGLAIGVAVPFVALRRGADRLRALRGVAGFAATTAVVTIPFGVQRLLEHPDVPARFGAFSVDRWPPQLLEGTSGDFLAVSLCAALVVVLVRLGGVPQQRERLGATLLLALLFLLSSLALPVSTILLGQTIQPYHFRHELVTFKTLVLLVGAGQLFDIGASALQSRLPASGASRSRLEIALVSMVAGLCIIAASSLHDPWTRKQRHMRSEFYAYDVPGYRDAFREVTNELATERYSDARVLATLDIQVLDWWSLFGGGQAFCPDPCATNLSDDELEARLLSLFRTLGASERDMMYLIHDRSVMIFFLACAKYQVSQWHRFAPLEDYPDSVRRKSLRSSPFDSWLIALPVSEANRLRARYARTRAVGDDLRLDLIVLGPGPLDRDLAPSPRRFEPTFENELFRVYVRRER